MPHCEASRRFWLTHGKEDQQEQPLFERSFRSDCQTREFRTILPLCHFQFRLLGVFTVGFTDCKPVVSQIAALQQMSFWSKMYVHSAARSSAKNIWFFEFLS